jgi:RNA polymerase sigma-70 factor, ECF subfamily
MLTGGNDLANEFELAARAATDAEAFSVLYDFYFPRVWSYVIRRVSHRQTAEDLTSQVFLKVVEALPRRRNDGPFGAWVFRIATNTLIDHYRVASRRPSEALEEVEAVASGDAQPDEVAEARLQFGMIEKILAELPERDRRIVGLKFFGGLSNREIAEVEGIAENNAGVVVHRALEKIRKQSEIYGKPE